MRKSIFFVCLCFFLLKGGDYVYAVMHSHGKTCSHAQSIQTSGLNESGVTSNAWIMLSNNIPGHQNEFVISDELKDEDPDNLSARKFKLLARCYSAFSSQFIGTNITYSKAATSLCGRVSYKYILQGVLRV
jgi:hypothetical protein